MRDYLEERHDALLVVGLARQHAPHELCEHGRERQREARA
jgi:hypothetical protein